MRTSSAQCGRWLERPSAGMWRVHYMWNWIDWQRWNYRSARTCREAAAASEMLLNRQHDERLEHEQPTTGSISTWFGDTRLETDKQVIDCAVNSATTRNLTAIQLTTCVALLTTFFCVVFFAIKRRRLTIERSRVKISHTTMLNTTTCASVTRRPKGIYAERSQRYRRRSGVALAMRHKHYGTVYPFTGSEQSWTRVHFLLTQSNPIHKYMVLNRIRKLYVPLTILNADFWSWLVQDS